jgi:predicted AAA+ superfamily ATPase
MYINRLIDKHLLDWAHAKSRKPLLLRGTRQVGKSSSVRQLAENFDNFVEINFEKQKAAAAAKWTPLLF